MGVRDLEYYLTFPYGFVGRDLRDDANGDRVSCVVVFSPLSTFARKGTSVDHVLEANSSFECRYRRNSGSVEFRIPCKMDEFRLYEFEIALLYPDGAKCRECAVMSEPPPFSPDLPELEMAHSSTIDPSMNPSYRLRF
jgi:hypothetical protein